MDETAAVTPPAAGNGGASGPRLSAKLRLSVRRRSKPAASSSLSTSSPGQETPSAAEVVDQEMLDLSERRRALFQPLGPLDSSSAASPEQQLLHGQPPPDFEPSSNPRDWVLGKKRKLVNVDVVESMRRIAVQEMNRKDREICGLNEQLEEDGRTMELLQMQMQQERAKRLQTERECAVLRGQVTMLMNILQETEEAEAVIDDDDHHDGGGALAGGPGVGDHLGHHQSAAAAAAAASHIM